MPVANYTHNEGEYWKVSVPNRKFTRTLLNTPFVNGEAQTRFERKAKEFDEVFGYLVIPYPGAPTWELAPDPAEPQSVAEEWDEEDYKFSLGDEEDFGEVGQFEKPVSSAKARKMGLTKPVRDGGIEDKD